MSHKVEIGELGIWIIIISLVVALLTGILAGGYNSETYVRKEAIQAGVAEWRVDPKTGVTAFHWLNGTTKIEK